MFLYFYSANGQYVYDLQAYSECLSYQSQFFYTIAFLLLPVIFYLTEFLTLRPEYEVTGLRKRIIVSNCIQRFVDQIDKISHCSKISNKDIRQIFWHKIHVILGGFIAKPLHNFPILNRFEGHNHTLSRGRSSMFLDPRPHTVTEDFF